MKKVISILISSVMVLSIFTSLPISSFAAKKAKKVSLKKSSVTLKIREKNGKVVYGTTKIKLKKAKGVTLKKVTYKSLNKKIACVSKKGKVTAKAHGNTKIKVKVKYKYKKKSYTKTLTFKVKVNNTITKISYTYTVVEPETTKPQPTEIVTEAAESSSALVSESAETSENVETTGAVDSTDPVSTDEPEVTKEPEKTTEPATTQESQKPAATGEVMAPTGGDVIYPTYSEDDTGHCTDHDMPGVTDPKWTGVTKPDGSPYYEYYDSQPNTNDDIQGDTSNCEEQESGSTDPDWTGVTKPDGSPYYEMYTTEPATEAVTEGETKAPTFNDKLSSFSNKLYTMCAKDRSKNYVMSPVSVYMALSMLYQVGDDGVKSDIKNFVEMNDSDLAQTGLLFNNLVIQYDEYSWEADGYIEESKLSLSNSIWSDNNIKMDSEELKKLADVLFMEAHSTSFADDNSAANKEIQDFICEKTNGLINEDFGLETSTVFALINTLYFKDVWDLDDMNELYTDEREFKTENGVKNCEFLYGNFEYGQVQETDTSYYFYTETKHGYKIKFVLPKDGCTLEEAMSADNLNKVNKQSDFNTRDKNGKIHLTNCIFPSFKIESDTDLDEVLKNNENLNNVFGIFHSPLTEDKDMELTVSEIVHKTVLNVNKEGIEGAAVTIVEIAPGSAGEEEDPHIYHHFVLDKNFGFIVTDYNDVILFEGQVVEP